jgi:hypothetical protein
MRLSSALATESRRKIQRNLVKLGLLITALLSLIVWIVTLYGQNVGSFVAKVDPKSSGISLSLDPNFSFETTRLSSEPVDNATNITQSDIPENITEGNGSKNDPQGNYIAYSFYLKNTGGVMLTYQSVIAIEGVYKNADSAIRLKVYEEKTDSSTSTVYAKESKVEEDGTIVPEKDPMGETTPFSSKSQVAKWLTAGFEVGQVTKYTIVIWLEGNDPDCTDSLKGGAIKFSMMFSIQNDIDYNN